MSMRGKKVGPSPGRIEQTTPTIKRGEDTFMLRRGELAGLRSEPFFLVLNGVRIGQEVPIQPGRSIIGRETADIQLGHTDVAISRHHAEVERVAGEIFIRDHESKNGVFVNDRAVKSTRLKHGDTVQLGNTMLKFFDHRTAEIGELATLLHSAVCDGLTGVCNKASFVERLAGEFSRARRHGETLSLLMIDLDHFKLLNDRHGHLAGDWVLVAVARTIESILRQEDLLARFGGEEFVVLAPDIDHEGARVLAERIREQVEQTRIAYRERQLSVTISIGGATLAAGEPSILAPEELIAIADRRLYEAKDAGRNRCR
jgi:diguanylate cyclase (GGDEF)-like protein